jgi:hypothetical protein
MPWSCFLVALFLCLGPAPAPSAGRIERFVLELAPEGGGPVQEVGWLELRAFAEKTPSRLEWEIYFAETEVRVLHVEHGAADMSRLVWREIGTRSRRSLVAVLEGSSAKITEWSSGECLREEIATCEGAILPLRLVEDLRTGALEAGPLEVFNPLQRRFERLEPGPAELASKPPDEADPASREVCLQREDGTQALRLVFRRDELLSLQWQPGGLRARRVGYADFKQLRSSMRPPSEG